MEQQQSQRVTEEGWFYANFVRRNPVGARSLESLLQYAGFFAPTRWADRDLAIESGHAAASLAALLHNQILLHGRSGDGLDLHSQNQIHSPDSAPGPTTTSTSVEYQSMARMKSAAAFAERMRVLLAIINHVQVVLEKLSGQHGGEQRKRQAIMYIETLKAVSRLLLLACTREMVFAGGVYIPGKRRSPQRRDRVKEAPWRQVNLAQHRTRTQPTLEVDPLPSTSSATPQSPEIYTGRRSGVRFVVPPRASVVWSGRGRSSRSGVNRQAASSYCSCSQRKSDGACIACRANSGGFKGLRGTDREGETSEINGQEGGGIACGEGYAPRRQAQLPSRTGEGVGGGGNDSGFSQAWLMAGEIVHIVRPLVYSYSCGYARERSWRPWVISLGMDAVSYACIARAGGGGIASLLPFGPGSDAQGVPILPHLDDEQAAELQRRKLQWFLYLIRSPVFELVVEPLSRGAAGVFEGIPLLGGAVGYSLNMLLYVQRHHFYISAS